MYPESMGFFFQNFQPQDILRFPVTIFPISPFFILLSTPMGILDYVVIGFDMEVQPLVTHNAA